MHPDRIQRPKSRPVIPARSSHLHDSCGHWCFKYGCTDGLGKCGECRSKEFNEQKAAEYAARQKSD